MKNITRLPITQLSAPAIALLLFFSSNACSDDIGDAFAQAQQIAAQRWKVSAINLLQVDGQNIATGTDGNILAGHDFVTRFTRDMTPANKAAALKFVMLHEMVHVAQKNDIPDVSPADPARKPFECQADMLASLAFFDSMFEDKSDNPEMGPKAALPTARLLKQLGAGEELTTPVSANGTGHLDKRERALAVHFGFLRALLKWMDLSGQKGDRIDKLRATSHRLLGPQHAGDEYAWSTGLCNAITRSISDVVGALFLNTSFDVEADAKANSAANFDKNSNFIFTNNTARTLVIQLIAVTGGYPKGAPEKYEDYIFTDASYGSVEIPPRSTGKIAIGYNFSSLDSERYDSFFWELPFDKNALISASYTGKQLANPNCNSGWENLGNSDIEQMAAAMVRIGLAEKDGFSSIVSSPLFPGQNMPMFHSSIEVPGATEVTIYRSSSNSFATAELYYGDDLKLANSTFEKTAEAFKKLCSTAGVKFSGKDTPDGASRHLRVANLTGYTEANLTLRTTEKADDSGKKTKRYQVAWGISAAD
ncbi:MULTISPECIES: hypothetical protein [unclassified Pseudomonas]|uniref:Lipoprotein n=1 Tax=Pseudomonas sp. MYb327 TaxID=2745230 RepID=A0AAU8E975_9PSED